MTKKTKPATNQKSIKVRDMVPRKDAKGGAIQNTKGLPGNQQNHNETFCDERG